MLRPAQIRFMATRASHPGGSHTSLSVGGFSSLISDSFPEPTPGPRYDTSKFQYDPEFVDQLEKNSVENWKRALKKGEAAPTGRRSYHTTPPPLPPTNQHAADYYHTISAQFSERQSWKQLVGQVGSAAFPPPSALEVARVEEEVRSGESAANTLERSEARSKKRPWSWWGNVMYGSIGDVRVMSRKCAF